MQILDLWGISFHAVVVFVLGKDLLFKSVLGRCERVPLPQVNMVNVAKIDKVTFAKSLYDLP